MSPSQLTPQQIAQQIKNNPSLERSMEQSDTRHDQRPMTAPGSKPSSGLNQLGKLVDPQEWLRQLYGLPESTPGDEHMKATEKAMKKGDQNHTPLNMKKLNEKHDANDLAAARRQFQWWQGEENRARQKLTQEGQQKKRAEQEQEERKKQEAEQARQQDAGGGEVQGKQKARLGQPRRKATTEQHPETKMGGAK